MHIRFDHCRRFSRTSITFLCGFLFLAGAAAPFLAAHSHPLPAALFYLLFSPICHQMPDRSFMLSGYPWAVCHRCSGIYLGLFLASLLPIRKDEVTGHPAINKAWIMLACLPIAFDALLPLLGLWTNTVFTRFFTGMLFGCMLATVSVRAVAQFAEEAFSGPRSLQFNKTHGGLEWTKKEC